MVALNWMMANADELVFSKSVPVSADKFPVIYSGIFPEGLQLQDVVAIERGFWGQYPQISRQGI